MRKKKRWLITAVGGAFLIILSEMGLRMIWGFCDAPLSIPSDKYEYCFAPNQDRYRFMHHIKYNKYSQRSEEPQKEKKKILGCGDSVINGGSQTDQKDIATSLFTAETGVQMLNISAGSWGPDNCAAYLKENGLFGAEGIIVCLSSHDAYDNMDFMPVVGKSVAYPEKQYWCAWAELIDRYLLPRVTGIFKQSIVDENDPDAVVNAGIQKQGDKFNVGWEELWLMAENAGIKFAVYLHAEKSEVVSGKYNSRGQEIIAWANEHGIPIYLGLENGEDLDGLRDNIHLNELGQRRLANTFEKIYQEWK